MGGEELGQEGTWVQEGAAWDIDSEGGGANGFCVNDRKGESDRISKDKSQYDLTNANN